MSTRKCTGCGAPLDYTDTYCRVCGRIQLLPSPPEHLPGEKLRLGSLLLLMILILVVLAAVAAVLILLDSG
jgi:hypothetical protein